MLAKQDIDKFKTDGYLVFPALLGEAKRKRYMEVFEELVAKTRALERDRPPTWILERKPNGDVVPGMLHKVQGVGVVDFRAVELASEPEIVSRVQALIGPSLAIFGTKFFPKLPGGGTSVSWHQDNFYFKTESDEIISCGVYLEAADRTNGCLRVIPGSHKAGIQRHERQKPTSAKGFNVELDDSKAVDVVCPGGTVVLFSANLLHGTNDNESSAANGRSRYSTAWHYLRPDMDLPPYSSGQYADWHVITK